MELDSLKYIWKKIEAPATGGNEEEEILALMQRRSEGPVARMRRNLYRECILILGTYLPTIGLYFLAFDGRLSGIGWLFVAILIFYAGYLYRKNSLLNKMQCAGCELRANLSRQVASLKRYTRFYVLSGTLLIPVMAVLSYGIIRWKFPPAPGAELFYKLSGLPWWQNPLYWLAPLALVTVGVYYLNAWYVRMLYGRHIAKLHELLDELDEQT